jgi:hypothetical protein
MESIYMKLSTLSITGLLCSALAGQAFAQTTPRKYKAGQQVEYVYDGKWFKAVILKVASDADVANFGPYHVYRVHSLGYNEYGDAWVSDFSDARAQLRPAGSGPTEPVPGGEASGEASKPARGATPGTPTAASSTQPPAKAYHCVMYIVNHLEDTAPFTLTGNGTYTDSEGKRGTYGFNSSSSTLTFHGGNYDGQRAEYETSGGRARLHILGPSGRRVIDCD